VKNCHLASPEVASTTKLARQIIGYRLNGKGWFASHCPLVSHIDTAVFTCCVTPFDDSMMRALTTTAAMTAVMALLVAETKVKSSQL
jgi:hypothetical protein